MHLNNDGTVKIWTTDNMPSEWRKAYEESADEEPRTSVVLAGVRALGRRTTHSHVHTRTATSLNEHLGGRCGVGVVVIKYETKNDFLYSKHLSGVFQHRLRSPRTYSEGWSISRGRSDSYHLNGSGGGYPESKNDLHTGYRTVKNKVGGRPPTWAEMRKYGHEKTRWVYEYENPEE